MSSTATDGGGSTETTSPSTTTSETAITTSTTSTTNTNTTPQCERIQRWDQEHIYIDTSNIYFEGDELKIGAVFATKSEKVTIKASFDAFHEKHASNIVR